MSVCVTIRTKKELVPDDIFNCLVERGEMIVITSDKFPSAKFGTYLKAIRGIEVNKESNGYEVRVCAHSSVADYELFAVTTQVIMDLTGGKAYFEDDDESEITKVAETLDDKWIEEQRKSSLNITRTLTKFSGAQIEMFGMFTTFCLGAQMYQRLGIPLAGEYQKEWMDTLQKYLCTSQWRFSDCKDTSSSLVFRSKSSNETDLTLSIISIEKNAVKPFDYISAASLLGIVDFDTKEPELVVIPFEETWKILPKGIFRPIDELQFERIGELSADMVREMMARARHLQTDDPYYRPTYPGKGFDEVQNTIILTWNPEISNVSIEEHKRRIPNMLTTYFFWEVKEYNQAKCGDRFFLVKQGAGPKGIVMSGILTSKPYETEENRGKSILTVDLKPNFILDPDRVPMLSLEGLANAFPSFDWSTSPSGSVLPIEIACKLEDLWQKYLSQVHDHIDNIAANSIDIR